MDVCFMPSSSFKSTWFQLPLLKRDFGCNVSKVQNGLHCWRRAHLASIGTNWPWQKRDWPFCNGKLEFQCHIWPFNLSQSQQMVQTTCVKANTSNVMANSSAAQRPNEQHCSQPKSCNAGSNRRLKIVTNLPMKHPAFGPQFGATTNQTLHLTMSSHLLVCTGCKKKSAPWDQIINCIVCQGVLSHKVKKLVAFCLQNLPIAFLNCDNNHSSNHNSSSNEEEQHRLVPAFHISDLTYQECLFLRGEILRALGWFIHWISGRLVGCVIGMQSIAICS